MIMANNNRYGQPYYPKNGYNNPNPNINQNIQHYNLPYSQQPYLNNSNNPQIYKKPYYYKIGN